MAKYIIIVDDEDRDQCPDVPWSATVTDGNGDLIEAGEAGLGTTLAEAVTEALAVNYLSEVA